MQNSKGIYRVNFLKIWSYFANRSFLQTLELELLEITTTGNSTAHSNCEHNYQTRQIHILVLLIICFQTVLVSCINLGDEIKGFRLSFKKLKPLLS